MLLLPAEVWASLSRRNRETKKGRLRFRRRLHRETIMAISIITSFSSPPYEKEERGKNVWKGGRKTAKNTWVLRGKEGDACWEKKQAPLFPLPSLFNLALQRNISLLLLLTSYYLSHRLRTCAKGSWIMVLRLISCPQSMTFLSPSPLPSFSGPAGTFLKLFFARGNAFNGRN